MLSALQNLARFLSLPPTGFPKGGETFQAFIKRPRDQLLQEPQTLDVPELILGPVDIDIFESGFSSFPDFLFLFSSVWPGEVPFCLTIKLRFPGLLGYNYRAFLGLLLCRTGSSWDWPQMLKQDDLSCDNWTVTVAQPVWYVGWDS